MYLIVFMFLLLYMVLIRNYYLGWRKIKLPNKLEVTPKVSVVIALRNEESKIEKLLNNLTTQIYPKNQLQFILANDHSTDNTLNLLQNSKLDNLIVLDMHEGDFGKKNAIAKAIQIAEGEIILMTDADCSFSPNWTQTMIDYFTDDRIKLVSGPVDYRQKKGIFQCLQTLEFTSLIGSGAGAIGSGNPIFCNGANMAYRKEVFLEVNNYKNDNNVSGDDVFLLHSVKKRYPEGIVFAKDKNAIVKTDSLNTLPAFINQRKRWTAKSSNYTDRKTIYTSCLVLFTNLSFLYLFLLCFFDTQIISYFIGFYLLKFIIDLIFLIPILDFFKRKDLIKWIFPFELFYSFYIVLIVMLSFTNSFEWKGRTHKK